MDHYWILVINMGSTSTRLAVYENRREHISVTIRHETYEIEKFDSIWDQYDYRKNQILDSCKEHNFDLKDCSIIVCRGGSTRPIAPGIYEINEEMLQDMKSGMYGLHATNVGNLFSYQLGKELGIPAITLDTPDSDELCDYARITGLPQIKRASRFHALSQKATARLTAKDMGRCYEEMNIIVAHMGGGISIGAHEKGRVIDVNNTLDGDGPFTPERAGSLPNAALARMCYSGKYSLEQMLKLFTGKGGMVALLGTSNGLDVEKRIQEGDLEAEKIYMAMAYKISREIGAAAATLSGEVDAIALTGSLARSEMLMDDITRRVSFIAPIYSYPGENEMQALLDGALRYLTGEEKAKIFGKEEDLV